VRRLLVATLLAITTVALLPVPAHAGDVGFAGWTNQTRASRGLPTLEWNGVLASKAQGWAQYMANGGCGAGVRICHSTLSSGNSLAWTKLGENVGTGPASDAYAIQQAFINSPSHYANIVDPGFRYIGVGVVNANGTLYVAVEFMALASQPAPSTPAPAAGTPSSPPATRQQSAPAPRPVDQAAPVAAPAPPPPAPPPPPPPPPPRVAEVILRLRQLEL